jgi:S-adenosylmethionine:tRNA ribosyltransferase-isomerase
MHLSDFDFDLPDELIAQAPLADRGAARMFVLPRGGGRSHAHVRDLPRYLAPGDLVVVNNTRVIPARLLGRRVPSGGAVECLLLGRLAGDRWDCLVHPGQKLRPGARFAFGGDGTGEALLLGEVCERHFHGRRTVRLWTTTGEQVDAVVDRIGHVPLPPYIRRSDSAEDRARYQTVFARERGSVAAPTAGLHFTEEMLRQLEAAGVERVELTLHVGYGTFKPVRSERIEDHHVDAETYELSEAAARTIDAARDEGRRIVAAGTTTVRALESAAIAGGGRLAPGRRATELFIHPPFTFQVTGALLTNFHLPKSSLLLLACAFGGRERVLTAYREAIALGYRFYSYGDAMLIL